MENIINTRKVNRELFAWRVVDINNDEFGFAQNNVIYTYVTDSRTKSKGETWLRMQRTGETGKDRRKYFLFFADETEASAYVDKHNDIYDMEGNYVASLVRSRFIMFLVIFIAAVIFFTGLAIYLGGSMIMDTTSPFSEDKTIHLQGADSTDGKGSAEQEINIFDTGDKKDEKEEKNPLKDAKEDIGTGEDIVLPTELDLAKESAKDEIRKAAAKAKAAIDASPDLSQAEKEILKAAVDEDARKAIKNIDDAKDVDGVKKALEDGLLAISDDLDDAIALEFVNKYCSVEPGNPFDKEYDLITKENYKKVIDGEDAYDNLTDKQREKVNKLIITPTEEEASIGYDKGEETFTGYAEMLRYAKTKLPIAHGKMTSDDNSRLIWPGQSDKFVFYVQNDGELPLNYQLSLSENNASNIPLRFKILMDGKYIVGSKNSWASTANFSGKNIEIDPGKTVQYKIIWEWPDENTPEANERDTKLGISSGQYIIQATVYFKEIL